MGFRMFGNGPAKDATWDFNEGQIWALGILGGLSLLLCAGVILCRRRGRAAAPAVEIQQQPQLGVRETPAANAAREDADVESGQGGEHKFMRLGRNADE